MSNLGRLDDETLYRQWRQHIDQAKRIKTELERRQQQPNLKIIQNRKTPKTPD